jgi:hypothetical protein
MNITPFVAVALSAFPLMKKSHATTVAFVLGK